MKIIFITNYAIFHQTAVWDVFSLQNKKLNFIYLATDFLSNERKQMHYKEESAKYIINSWNLSSDELEKVFKDTDLIIYGCSEDKRITKYLKLAKKVIFFHEHIIKRKTLIKLLAVFNQTRKYKKMFPHAQKYLLCPSYFSYKENLLTKFIKKENCFKFGYFPKTILLENKKEKTIVWSGRFLKWKHPEIAIYFIEKININCAYTLNMYGNGERLNKIQKLKNCSKENLNISRKLFIPNELLLEKFSKSEIGLFTSDRGEGWGVVLNEMMSQGCIVFANINAGSTRYLVKNGYNGFTYKTKKELNEKIDFFNKLTDVEKINISKNATKTIYSLWNNKIAGERLYSVCSSIINNKELPLYTEGPLSRF